jgi:hypothetical protein
MRVLLFFVFLFSSFQALAVVKLKLDYKYSNKNHTIAMAKEFSLELDNKVLISMPGSKNQVLEIEISQNLPKSFPIKTISKEKLAEMLLVNMKIIESKNGTENIISSPQVLTKFGSEAIMEMGNDDGVNTQIKLLATK